MNRERLEQCNSLQDAINEIVIQNYNVLHETMNLSYDKFYGYYSMANKHIENSHFDVLFHYAEKCFLQTIQKQCDVENCRADAFVMMYAILIEFFINNTIYCEFCKAPTTMREFIDIIFNDEISLKLNKYFCSILNRRARNLLYTTLTHNGYSQYTYYYNQYDKNGKQIKAYNNISYLYLDKPQYCYTTEAEVDKYEFISDVNKTLESEFFIVSDSNMSDTLLHFFSNGKRDLFKSTNVNYDNVKGSFNSSQIREKIDKKVTKEPNKYNSLKIINDKIQYGGDYLKFGKTLMDCNDKVEKFYIIHNALENKDRTSDIVTELIYSLDTKIIKQFFDYYKDDTYLYYYVQSAQFTLIVNTLLAEYFAKQTRFKEIYLYNETQRVNKINLIKTEIKNNSKDNIISNVKLNIVWKLFIKEFHLDSYITKNKLNMTEFKIEKFKSIGITLIKENGRSYKVIM